MCLCANIIVIAQLAISIFHHASTLAYNLSNGDIIPQNSKFAQWLSLLLLEYVFDSYLNQKDNLKACSTNL